MPTYLRKDVERTAPHLLANARYDKTLRYVQIDEAVDGIGSHSAIDVPAPTKPDIERWPWWARCLARLRAKADSGIGDTIERIARRFGGRYFIRFADRFGGCGCKSRQHRLNVRFRY
jgi:hypothetical protein